MLTEAQKHLANAGSDVEGYVNSVVRGKDG